MCAIWQFTLLEKLWKNSLLPLGWKKLYKLGIYKVSFSQGAKEPSDVKPVNKKNSNSLWLLQIQRRAILTFLDDLDPLIMGEKDQHPRTHETLQHQQNRLFEQTVAEKWLIFRLGKTLKNCRFFLIFSNSGMGVRKNLLIYQFKILNLHFFFGWPDTLVWPSCGPVQVSTWSSGWPWR